MARKPSSKKPTRPRRTAPGALKAVRTTKEDSPLSTKAAREALDNMTRAIKRLQKDAGRNAWSIGRRLVQVAELRLYRSRGFSSVVEYAEKVLAVSAATAFAYMRVASAFSEEITGLYGIEKLDRGLMYIARTPEEESTADVPELKIRVPAEGGGDVVAKPFAEVTVAELRRAVQGVRPKDKKAKRSDLPEEVSSVIAKADRALDRAVGRAAAAGASVAARLAREGGKQVIVDLRGIPLERLKAVLRAVAMAVP
ncbi:MAG: hypothetical protein HY698_07540 [Deltaproteobacteria bacterium]|nr:hypothetical protein [Deltaproteobacteria bacterium]